MSMRGGGGPHGGWGSIINAPDERPKVTWGLLKRVMRHAAPYRRQIAGMLAIILLSTGLSLLSPLIMREAIVRGSISLRETPPAVTIAEPRGKGPLILKRRDFNKVMNESRSLALI